MGTTFSLHFELGNVATLCSQALAWRQGPLVLLQWWYQIQHIIPCSLWYSTAQWLRSCSCCMYVVWGGVLKIVVWLLRLRTNWVVSSLESFSALHCLVDAHEKLGVMLNETLVYPSWAQFYVWCQDRAEECLWALACAQGPLVSFWCWISPYWDWHWTSSQNPGFTFPSIPLFWNLAPRCLRLGKRW